MDKINEKEIDLKLKINIFVNDEKIKSRAFLLLARAYLTMGRSSMGRAALDSALVYDRDSISDHTVLLYNTYAEYYYQKQGNYDSALIWINRALTLSERLKDRKTVSELLFFKPYNKG